MGYMHSEGFLEENLNRIGRKEFARRRTAALPLLVRKANDIPSIVDGTPWIRASKRGAVGHTLSRDPQLVDTVSEEFFPGASDAPSGSNRRQFMQLLGASMAMAGLAACRRPVEHIMPFADRPEETIPGIPLRYATAMNFSRTARPLVVKSYDGRPVKVEGNNQHPNASGASGV